MTTGVVPFNISTHELAAFHLGNGSSMINILRLLDEHPEGLRYAQIGKMLSIGEASLPGMTEWLQNKGYMETVQQGKVNIRMITEEGSDHLRELDGRGVVKIDDHVVAIPAQQTPAPGPNLDPNDPDPLAWDVMPSEISTKMPALPLEQSSIGSQSGVKPLPGDDDEEDEDDDEEEPEVEPMAIDDLPKNEKMPGDSYIPRYIPRYIPIKSGPAPNIVFKDAPTEEQLLRLIVLSEKKGMTYATVYNHYPIGGLAKTLNALVEKKLIRRDRGSDTAKDRYFAIKPDGPRKVLRESVIERANMVEFEIIPTVEPQSKQDGELIICPNCKSNDVVKSGGRYSASGRIQYYKCRSCGGKRFSIDSPLGNDPIKQNGLIKGGPGGKCRHCGEEYGNGHALRMHELRCEKGNGQCGITPEVRAKVIEGLIAGKKGVQIAVELGLHNNTIIDIKKKWVSEEAPKSYRCYCGREFGTLGSRSIHQMTCKVAKEKEEAFRNGTVKGCVSAKTQVEYKPNGKIPGVQIVPMEVAPASPPTTTKPTQAPAKPQSREVPPAPEIKGEFCISVTIVKKKDLAVKSLPEMRDKIMQIREAFGGSLKGIRIVLSEGNDEEGDSND